MKADGAKRIQALREDYEVRIRAAGAAKEYFIT